MSTSPTGATAATNAAVQKVDAIEPAAKAEQTNVSTALAPIAKWPWWATLVIAVVLLAALFVFQSLLWCFIRDSSEKLEGEDFDQLKAIADNVQTVVVLLVGAIFGVGVTQGAVAGAAKAAEENKKVAEQAATKANENAKAATDNAARADGAVAVAKDLATAITTYTQTRRADDTRFIADGTAVRTLLASGSVAPQDLPLIGIDPELDEMAADAELVLRRLR